jgi:surface protein
MQAMFNNASVFNQSLSGWDTSSVTDMRGLFNSASAFSGDISNWDTSSVANMIKVFANASVFNGDLSGWDTSSVTDMSYMFNNASVFNQPLNEWDVRQVTDMSIMFDNSGFSTDNYDGILKSWSLQDVQSGVTLGAAGINYCNGEDARQSLIDTHGWIIDDAGLDCSTAGVDDQNQLDISIYPNPSSDIVYIDGNYTQLKVVVYDVLGKQVMNKSITNSINISHLDNGVYILQISDRVKLITRKIIKN